jgi:hypothetical protein
MACRHALPLQHIMESSRRRQARPFNGPVAVCLYLFCEGAEAAAPIPRAQKYWPQYRHNLIQFFNPTRRYSRQRSNNPARTEGEHDRMVS